MSALSHPENARTIALRRRVANTSGLATTLTTFFTTFVAAALLFHVAVGVMGHALVERTRQSARMLEDTSKRVRAATVAFQRSSERTTNPSAIAAWAQLHGFQSSFLASRQDAPVE